jgi:outer membrane receptor protein involved in Fe transport
MARLNLRAGCALVALISGMGWASTAQAQTAAADKSMEDAEIIVTGSFIRGTREDAAVPVDVFTADDLNKQGVTSPLEFIKQLPSVGATLGDSNQYSTASQGFQGNGSLNLRGLGPTRTLVLFNGRRTVLAPGDGFIDTNLIPIFALQNIEEIMRATDAVMEARGDLGGLELVGDEEPHRLEPGLGRGLGDRSDPVGRMLHLRLLVKLARGPGHDPEGGLQSTLLEALQKPGEIGRR